MDNFSYFSKEKKNNKSICCGYTLEVLQFIVISNCSWEEAGFVDI